MHVPSEITLPGRYVKKPCCASVRTVMTCLADSSDKSLVKLEVYMDNQTFYANVDLSMDEIESIRKDRNIELTLMAKGDRLTVQGLTVPGFDHYRSVTNPDRTYV